MNRRTLDRQCHYEKLAVVQKSSNFKVSKRCGLLLIGWLVLKRYFEYDSIKGWRSVVVCSAGSKARDKEGGGWGGGASRPLDKEGPGLQKIFSTLRASVWSKNKVAGGGGRGWESGTPRAPPLDPPLVFPLHDHYNTIVYFCTRPLHPPPSLQKSCTTQC